MKELRFVQDYLRDILEAMDKAEEFTNGRPAITMCLTAHEKAWLNRTRKPTTWHGRVTIGEAIKLTRASRNTLKQHFRTLVERATLNQHGSGRGV